jgi:8-oxo-dGTP diphosphatase
MYVRRVALFVLRDKEGRVVLQHRDENAPTKPNQWALFGGEIEKEETPEEAVRREAEEELHIKLKGLRFFKRYEFKETYGARERFVFVAGLDKSIEELKKQQMEGDDMGLFSFKDIGELNISENDMRILKGLFNK